MDFYWYTLLLTTKALKVLAISANKYSESKTGKLTLFHMRFHYYLQVHIALQLLEMTYPCDDSTWVDS